jgi:L-fuculose-phosphate aldolase
MTKVERTIIDWGRRLFERRLISGWGGNLSCRSGKDRFWITGQHAPLGFLNAKDLVQIDASGNAIDKGQRPSSETPMHIAVYAKTDAAAIVHVHPPMVIAFSLSHEKFVPVSFEEKYTIGEVPIIEQDTPTVTQPEKVVEELKFHSVVIIKGHGTVAIGNSFQEAFLLTDLLEEAVHCHFFKERLGHTIAPNGTPDGAAAATMRKDRYALFSQQHMQALVDEANQDAQFRNFGAETALTTSLTLVLDETQEAWTVRFDGGEITGVSAEQNGEFMIGGKAEWWNAVFSNRIDPFLATQQGKLKLQRGELAQLSRWYKPFQRAFALWQTIPIR